MSGERMGDEFSVFRFQISVCQPPLRPKPLGTGLVTHSNGSKYNRPEDMHLWSCGTTTFDLIQVEDVYAKDEKVLANKNSVKFFSQNLGVLFNCNVLDVLLPKLS